MKLRSANTWGFDLLKIYIKRLMWPKYQFHVLFKIFLFRIIRYSGKELCFFIPLEIGFIWQGKYWVKPQEMINIVINVSDNNVIDNEWMLCNTCIWYTNNRQILATCRKACIFTTVL